MKSIIAVIPMLLLAACTTQSYQAERVGYYEKPSAKLDFNLSLGTVRYLPPSGVGQRSASISGGPIMLFLDATVDFDSAIDDFSKKEINRALGNLVSLPTGADDQACVLGADVLYLKISEFLPDKTHIRYSLWKSGKQVHDKVVKTQMGSYVGGYSGVPADLVQHYASGIHRNLYTYLRSPDTLNALSNNCSK